MKILYAFFILVAGLPVQALAGGCDCGPIQSMIRQSQQQIIQSVNANTNLEAQAIRSDILLAAQNIIGTIKTETATVVRAIISLKESNAALIKGQAIAKEAMTTQDLYGKAAQPTGLCGSSALGAGVQLGAQASRQVHQSMRQKQLEYANNKEAKPLDYLNRVLAKEHPDVKQVTDSLFPLESTLKADEVALAQESIKTLGNPRPMPMVTDAQENTPAGQTYAAARAVHDGRLALAMETLNHHVAYHAPTLPDDMTAWAQNQWKEAGGSGTPPGIVDGKLSQAGLYRLLSQMRMGNPNWFAQIASSTEAGLLREQVLMQAIQLELTRQNAEYLDRLTFITSLDYLTRMEGTMGKEMEELYTQMIGTQQ